jgi:Protein of unknown function (DUF1320)
MADTTQYCTIADVVAAGIPQGEINALMGNPGNLIISFINARSREASAYFRQRYTLPLTSWDESITMAVAKLVAFDCIRKIGFNPADPAGGNWVAMQKEAYEFFRDVAAERINPEVVDSSTPTDVETEQEIMIACDFPARW